MVLLLCASAVWWLWARDGGSVPPALAIQPLTTRACPDQERLARRYAPALALAPDDQAPRTVELFLDRAVLVYKDGDRAAQEAPVSPARLAQLANQPEAFLALPPPVDDAAAQRRLYEQTVAADRSGRYAVTAYASVHCDANTSGLAGHTVVQYWLFYMYNDGWNKHEGDWELIQIVLGPDGKPQFAAYAQHNSYTWRDWSEMLVEQRVNEQGELEEHPHVYVARGSHASYFQYAPGGYGGDVVVDTQEFVIPQVRLLPPPEQAEPATFGWLRFPGAWGSDVPPGNACRRCERGPVGPIFNSGGQKWRAPLTWGGRRLNRDDLLAHGIARVLVRGASTVHFYDAQGRHTGPLPGGRMERAAPGVAHLRRPGSDVHIVLIPGLTPTSPGRIELEGGTVGRLDVLIPDGGHGFRLQFDGVALGANGRARLVLGVAQPVLEIDADGDGRYERSLAPISPPGVPPPEGGVSQRRPGEVRTSDRCGWRPPG